MNDVITYSFTENYLDQLSDYLDQNYIAAGRDLGRVAVIFGGKRPALFCKRNLARLQGKSFYPPRFFTIDEFMKYVVSKKHVLQPVQDLDSSFLLYQIAREKCPQILKGRETFARFLPWTKEISGFIDQLDVEDIDNARLKNIEANAQIGYAVPGDINQLLQYVVTLRRAYHERLDQDDLSSRGLNYLRAARMIQDISFEEFDDIIFANFFYFNRCEETVALHLKSRDKARFIFQGDERKWPAFRRIAKKLDHRIVEGDEPFTPQFDLKLHSAFDLHSQTAMVREILKQIPRQDQTVIVLPDPQNIVPLLAEVGQIAKEFNISMGYPLKRSSLYTLFELIFKTQLSRKAQRYYAKDYLKVLSHPLIKNLKVSGDESLTRILVHKIEEVLTGQELVSLSGSLFIEPTILEESEELYDIVLPVLQRQDKTINRAGLKEILQSLHQTVFGAWEDIVTLADFSNTLKTFLDLMVEKSFMHNYALNNNIALKMYDLIDELSQAAFNREQFSPEDIFRIFDNRVSKEIVAFVGSPLKGLQILGLFETRALNFDHVIVMDVNEGVLPHLNIHEPLIPREVMISLGLDRLELEEEIQRYQFMRLISAAKNVHLVYQESKDKERSRFIEELIWEEEKKAGKIDVVPHQRAGFHVQAGLAVKSVQKTPAMIEALKQHRFSASSVNTYLRNPMDFYYNYVLGLREQEDLLDEPEARHVGTFVHELLEETFRPFLNKQPQIDTKFRDAFFSRFDERFEERFGKSMRGDAFLLKKVVHERLSRFLENEAENPYRRVRSILHLESRFEEVIPLSCGPVRFAYIVDRVDELADGTVMIIDYKTGSVDVMPQAYDKVETLELSRESIRDTIQSFQIPLYFHYLHKQFAGRPINAALYNLRTMTVSRYVDKKMEADYERLNKAFLRALDFIMTEIFNPQIDFIEDVG